MRSTYNRDFEVGLILSNGTYTPDLLESSVKVSGFYLKWHVGAININEKKAGASLYNGIFKYWSLVYPECVSNDKLVWTNNYRNRRITTCTYFKDGTFVFELNGWWLYKKGLHNSERRQQLCANVELYNSILQSEFQNSYLGKLSSTLSYMPKDRNSWCSIGWAQMRMFYSEEQLLKMLLVGKKFDAEDKVKEVFRKVHFFTNALKSFRPLESPPKRLKLD
jgi:hypothetical protein